MDNILNVRVYKKISEEGDLDDLAHEELIALAADLVDWLLSQNISVVGQVFGATINDDDEVLP